MRTSVLICLLLFSTPAAADGPPVVTEAAPPTPALLPLDGDLLRGRLDNGLQYFIRENDRPEARAELRLVVRAGSIDEDEDQRGIAHFVEHMVFNGTEKWAGNDIIRYLESIGARFGADLNAYTSFDETVYRLTIPTDREQLLEQGLEVLAQFAAAVRLNPDEIEREKGVVLDEWRGNLGAGRRISDYQLPILLHGSRYATRLPIGLPEILESADSTLVRRFYQDWYHPSRMALIAVGDFAAAEMESQVQRVFGALASEPGPRGRPNWLAPAHADTLFALADDAELRATSVSLSIKRPPLERRDTEPAYRYELVRRMAHHLFNERLSEIARQEDPPFIAAYLSTSPFGRSLEITRMGARVQPGGEARALATLTREASRVRTHGFLESELERARRRLIAGIEASWAEREKTQSAAYAGEYARHFLQREPLPGLAFEVEFWRRELPGVTLEECRNAFDDLMRGEGVVVQGERPSDQQAPEEDELLASLRQTHAPALEAWEEKSVAGELLAEEQPPGRVIERQEHATLGLTEILLSNGVRVFLKPTDFQDDDVRFRGIAFGGTSLADDEDLLSASTAVSLIGESGFGEYTASDLAKLLAGKVASVRPFLGGRRHGIHGSSTVADLPTALDLVTLVMTAPRCDSTATARVLTRMEAQLANRDADPGTRYSDRVNALQTADHPRARPLTVERLDEIDPEYALAYYRSRFANAADFTFFFVGNLDVDALLPELERTLGALPSSDAPAASWVDRDVRYRAGSVREVVRAGQEPRGHVTLSCSSYDSDDPREWHRMRAAAAILERRLRTTLREELGATYGVSVGYSRRTLGDDAGRISVRFGADPQRIDEWVGSVVAVLEELKESGPTEEEIATEQEMQTRALETQQRQNGFWLGSLASLWERGRPLEEVLTRRERIEALQADELSRVLREYFPFAQRMEVHWIPESESP